MTTVLHEGATTMTKEELEVLKLEVRAEALAASEESKKNDDKIKLVKRKEIIKFLTKPKITEKDAEKLMDYIDGK